MLDPNRNRNQLPPPVTTGRGAYTPGTPIAPRTGPRVATPQRVDFSSTPALQKLLQPAPASTKGYTQSNVNADRSGAGLVAPALPPPAPPSKGGETLPPPRGGGLVPAAQAAAPFVAPPLAKPASFTDPAGRERVFADQASADAASAKIQSPQGMEDLKRSILNRKFDITSTGQIPEGTFTPQELEFAAPGPAQQVSLVAPPVLSRVEGPVGSPTRPPSPARGEGAAPAIGSPTPPQISVPGFWTGDSARARGSRDSAVAGLVEQGITDPKIQLDFLNFLEDGSPSGGNFTADEIAKYGTGGGGGTDVIRGTDITRTGRTEAFTGPKGQTFDALANVERDRGQPMTPAEQAKVDFESGPQRELTYQEALANTAQARLEHGSPSETYLPLLAAAEKSARDQAGKPLSLTQAQAQRYQQLQQPGAELTEADRLVFGKGGAAVAPKLYSKPEYDQYGAKTGEVPYLYDAEGNARPLNFAAPAAAGAPEGGTVQAPPAAIAKLKKNPQFAAAFKAKYGYLPAGL